MAKPRTLAMATAVRLTWIERRRISTRSGLSVTIRPKAVRKASIKSVMKRNRLSFDQKSRSVIQLFRSLTRRKYISLVPIWAGCPCSLAPLRQWLVSQVCKSSNFPLGSVRSERKIGRVEQLNGGADRPARKVGSRKRARGFPKGRQLDLAALSLIHISEPTRR